MGAFDAPCCKYIIIFVALLSSSFPVYPYEEQYCSPALQLFSCLSLLSCCLPRPYRKAVRQPGKKPQNTYCKPQKVAQLRILIFSLMHGTFIVP